MSLVFVDGFDTYQMVLQKWDAWLLQGFGNPPTILPTSGRNSGGCLNFDTSVSPQQVQKNFPNAATMFCGFALNIDPSGITGDLIILNWTDGASVQVDLRITSSGHLYFTRSGTVIGTQSVQTLPFRSWHYVEVFVTIDPAAGVAKLNVDGVSWLNLTAQNTRQTANSFTGGIQIGNQNRSISLMQIDDFYLANTSGSVNTTFLGDVRVQGMVPTGNGSTLNYTMVASSWTASTTKGIGQTILDSNGNLQIVTAVATDAKTGGSAPTWATVAGTTTVDNHVTWTCLGVQSQFLQINQNPPEGSATRLHLTAYAIGTMVWDSNGNLQLCTAAGTSANNENLTWNTTPGGTTPDGSSLVWTNLGVGEDTYLSSNTVGDISRFTFPAITASSIKAAVINLRARKDDVSTRSVRGAIKSGATLGDTGTDLILSQTYQTLQGISEVDPATSAAYTQAGFNAAEFGIKTTA